MSRYDDGGEARDRFRAKAEDYPGLDPDDLSAVRAALDELRAAAIKCGQTLHRYGALDRYQSAVIVDGAMVSPGQFVPAEPLIEDLADEVRVAAAWRLTGDYKEGLGE
ncbi:MAG: hypothetical protein AB7P35_17860 [Hyphomonadaceae bacterium]